MTVRDLFFNTPARRKFLRTTHTELGHVTEQLTRLALPHADRAFTLRHNGRETLNLPAVASTSQRLSDLFGSDLAASLLPITARRGDIEVSGLIGPPAAARGSAKWQYVFLNGRYIRDRLVSHALREAYRGLIEPSRSPVAFVFLQIDPGEVDVNVHPTKIEVRFRNGQAVHGQLLAALKETLNKASLTPAVTWTDPSTATSSQPAESAEVKARQQSLRQALADFFKSTPSPQPRLSFPEPPPRPGRRTSDVSLPAAASCDSAIRTGPSAEPQTPPSEPTESSPRQQALQIHNSYIVVACPDGLEIIDQHALHERLLYNDLKHRLADPSAPALTAQRMLIPATLTVTPAEAALLTEHTELLEKLGLEVAAFGPETVAVQQFPVLLAQRGVVPEAFLTEVLDRLSEDKTSDPEPLLEDLLEMLACKAAVKAGQTLSDEEIASLLARSEEAEKASACPHGRPTRLKLTLKDLQKQFKRT